MKARNLMVPLQEYLRPEMSLKDAAHLFRLGRRDEKKLGVKALPVLNEDKTLAGILSIGDIFRTMVPLYTQMVEQRRYAWEALMEAFNAMTLTKQVQEVMTHQVISVPADIDLMECLNQMTSHKVKRMPVLEGDGQVAGMIYERDIFYFLFQFFI
jgi:CBS domain-containing protein